MKKLSFYLDEVVALKRLKMEKEKEGFPITSLREICCILKSQHENVCTVRVSFIIRKKLLYHILFILGNSCW